MRKPIDEFEFALIQEREKDKQYQITERLKSIMLILYILIFFFGIILIFLLTNIVSWFLLLFFIPLFLIFDIFRKTY